MSTAKFDDLEEDTLLEALSHFNLVELEKVRLTSRKVQAACDARKAFIHSLLTKGTSVEIFGLASERGKQINNRLAVITDGINNGRYPVKVQHLTGEIEKVSLKPQNINPFLKLEQEANEKPRLDFVNYSSDARVREGHGRLLDQVLMLLRYAVNLMNGMSYFEGEFEDFCRLDRADQRVSMANRQVFSMYRVKPSEAGYRVPGDMSILDSTIHSLAEFEGSAVDMFGKMAKYEKDGCDGKLIVRNMVRFMQSWDKERITGEFWITKIVKSGTLVVQKNSDAGEGSEIGRVFLVKGIGSQVGSQVPASQLPLLVRTTFLPIYNMLVYDGIMMADARSQISPSLKEKIQKHANKAVREQTVVYCGESASNGLWNTEPPKIVKPVPSEGYTPMGQKKDDDKGISISYKPTPKQLNAATEIVKLAQKCGFKSAGRVPGMPLLIVRRMGYTREDNPMQMVGLLFHINDNPCGMDVFYFKDWPVYTLDELLPELAKKMKNVNIVPGMIMLDEQTLVEPLRRTLEVANEAVGFHQKVEVEWYPPPSEEEQAFNRY